MVTGQHTPHAPAGVYLPALDVGDECCSAPLHRAHARASQQHTTTPERNAA